MCFHTLWLNPGRQLSYCEYLVKHYPTLWHTACRKYFHVFDKDGPSQSWHRATVLTLNIHSMHIAIQSGCQAAGAFKSTGSILKDANTSGSQAEAHRGGIRGELRISQGSSDGCQCMTRLSWSFAVFTCNHVHYPEQQNQRKCQRSRHYVMTGL